MKNVNMKKVRTTINSIKKKFVKHGILEIELDDSPESYKVFELVKELPLRASNGDHPSIEEEKRNPLLSLEPYKLEIEHGHYLFRMIATVDLPVVHI